MTVVRLDIDKWIRGDSDTFGGPESPPPTPRFRIHKRDFLLVSAAVCVVIVITGAGALIPEWIPYPEGIFWNGPDNDIAMARAEAATVVTIREKRQQPIPEIAVVKNTIDPPQKDNMEALAAINQWYEQQYFRPLPTVTHIKKRHPRSRARRLHTNEIDSEAGRLMKGELRELGN